MSRYEDIKNSRKSKTEEEKKQETEKQSRYQSIKANRTDRDYGVDDTFINTFLRDANSFFSTAQNDYRNLTWQSGTDAEAIQSRNSTLDDLRSRAAKIRGYANANKSRLDEKTYKELLSVVDNVDSNRNSVWKAFREAEKQFSQFDSEDAYSAAVREFEYQQKYGGKSYDELKEILGTIDPKSDEYSWLEKYAPSVMTKEDYDKEIPATEAEMDKLIEYQKADTWYRGYQANPDAWATDPDTESLLAIFNNMVAEYGEGFSPYDAYNSAEERLWNLKKQRDYSFLEDRADFDTVSANIPTEKTAGFGIGIGGKWFGQGDPQYDYINNIENYRMESSAQGMRSGVTNPYALYDHMNPEEVAKYNYLYHTEGKDSANAYLGYLEYALNDRKMNAVAQNAQAFANEAPVLSSATSIPANLISIIGYGDAMRQKLDQGLTKFFTNEYSGPVDYNTDAMAPSVISSSIRGTVARNIADSTGVINIDPEKNPIFAKILNGKSLGDVYQLGMSVADSLTSQIAGPFGVYLLGGSASTQSMLSAVEKGATDEQALSLGFFSGAFETLFEKVSLDNLFKGETNGIIKTILKQAGFEGSEELFTSVSNTIADICIMAEKSDYSMLVQEYIDKGLSPEDAQKQALTDTCIQYAWDFVGGVASGSVMAGGKMSVEAIINKVGSAVQSYKATNAAGRTIMGAEGGVDALKELANKIAGDSDPKMQKTLTKKAGAVSSETATGKGLVGKAVAGVKNASNATKVGRLYSTVQTANNLANASANQADIVKSLERKGFATENATAIAEALVASYNGQDLTKAQRKLLDSVKDNPDVQAAVSNIVTNEQSTMGQRRQNIRNFDNEIAIGMVMKSLGIPTDAERIKTIRESAEEEFTPDGDFSAAAEGKAIIHETGEVIDIKGVSSIRKGEMLLDIGGGKTVSAKDVDYASDSQALIYEAIANIGDNIDAATANKLISQYKGGDALLFGRGIAQAYTYGFYGIDKSELSAKHSLATKLTPEQVTEAYNLGKKYRPVKDTADTAKARVAKAPAGKGVYYRSKDGSAMDISTYLKESGITLNDTQKTGIEAMRKMSEMMGVRFNVFESWVEDGKRYYLDQNGVKTEGNPNGFYDTRTGEIYIDLQAGNDFQGTMLFTVAHELTHFMRQWSPAHFTKIAGIVFKHGGMKGSVSEQIALKQKKAKEKGKPISYDVAMEEVVADGMETILKDGKVVEFMAEVKQKDRVAWEKIKGWFKNLAKFLRKMVWAYKGKSAQTLAGQKVADFSENLLRQIEQIWAEGAVAAGENYQAAEVQKNTTGDGGVKYSLDYSDAIEQLDDGTLDRTKNTHLKVLDSTPQVYIDKAGAKDLKIIMGWDIAYLAMNKSGVLPGNYHGLGADVMKDIPRALQDPIYIIKQNNGRIIAVTEVIVKGNRSTLVSIEMNTFKSTTQDGENESENYNLIVTIFDAKTNYLKNLMSSGEIVHNKNNEDPAHFILRLKSLKKALPDDDHAKSSNKDISQDEAEVKYESTEAIDIEVDDNTESVAPAVLNSERTWTESDYVQEREKAAKEISKAIGVPVKKALDYIDSINSIAKMIAEDRVRLDYFSSPGRSSFVSNVEYGGSFDFSTLCKKRRLLTGTFTAIQKALPNTALTAEEILDIRNRMKDAGLEVSCGLCYVEGSRANMGQFAKEFLKLYKQYYPDAWQPNMADVNTPDGIEWVRINHPECYEQYEYFWNHYGTLKPGDKNLFASQQKPKLYQLHTEYKGEILDKFTDDDNVEEKNLNGGIRLQSFSDFEIVHLIDVMQIIMDMSRVGLAGQAYTKVPDFAWALGDTGLKINLSLIAKGVDENGRLIFDDVEGMPIDTAVELRNRYSKNVGTILVAFNDEQLLAAMADDRVDFIIPFHRSQWKKSQYAAMGLPAKTKDYTYMQNEKYIRPQYHEYRGRMVKDKASNYMPNEYWDFSKSGKENAEAYLEMCARNNKRPKFYKLLKNNGDGSYSLKADGSTDGYWKLLIDFKMYDNDGIGSPQMPVKPDFNMEEATRMLSEYSGGHSNFPVAQGVVDSFVEAYKDSHEGAMFSDRDSDYFDAVNRGDMETAQRMVDEAAKAAGYTTNGYHGSPSDFTVVEGNLWLSRDELVARYYYGRGRENKNAKSVPRDIHGVYSVRYRLGKNLLINADSNSWGNLPVTENEYPGVYADEETGEISTNAMAEWAENHGYDSVSFVNVYDGGESPTAVDVIFNPKRDVKSADPVTYDDSGNVIPLSERFNTEKDDIRFSDPETDYSNRSLLANAFEGVAQNDIELAKVQEYREKVELLDAEERRLREINEEIKELSFAKGPRDTKRIRELRDEAQRIANRISIYDGQLLRLEASKPLQAVLEREKKKAYKKAAEKGREALADYRERAVKGQVKVKIKNFKKRLESMLLRPTDRQYIPIDLINAMVDVCTLIDTDTDLIKADGSINKAQEKRNTTKEKLQTLKDEYEKLKTHSDPIYAGEFDEMVYAYLTELRDKFSGKHLNEMSFDELTEMYEILVAIDETLRDARKLIGWGDAENVYEAGDAIVEEQRKITADRKNGKRSWFGKANDGALNLSLAPVRNVERMSGYNGDSYLLRLFRKFEKGIRKKNMFVMEAYKDFEALTSGSEYDGAIYKEVGGKKYTDIKGRKFGVSKMQMMQAILSYEREQANKHLNHVSSGGFNFADLDMLSKGRLKDATSEEYSHRVPNAVGLVEEFVEILKDDKWCQDYMEAARKFFNGKAKDAINETTIILKHRIVAKDKSYIPFESDRNFVNMEISAENNIQQTINSYGMLKDTKSNAPQPLIITGLNNVLDRHIEMVGNVYGLAVEVRNFNKVWNVRSLDEAGDDSTVKAKIQENWGMDGVNHIEQAVKDIQGPRVRERNALTGLYDKVKSGYIGATFLLNLSVVTKQVGSLFASTSMLRWRDPVRQIGNLIYTMANHKKISAEVDKYTASAWMRRQGVSDAELHTLMTERKKSWLGRQTAKLPAIFNPAKWITAMDHAVALSLWRYAKIDTAKRTGLKGEELLKATAEFYDDVIENTQSMTDVLHRPEIQKQHNVISEAFAMFKTDLYQMAGQLHVTAGRFMTNKSKENGKALGRTLYAVAMSAVWGQLMTTVFALLRYKVKQYRDEEDEELTMESWLSRQGFALVGDLMGYIIPILGSEIVGVFENIKYGESEDIVDNFVLTLINDLYDAMITIGTSVKDKEMPDPADMKKIAAKALQAFGVPANNILRIFEAIQLHAKDIANGEFFSFEAGVERSPKHHIHRIIEAIDEGNLSVARGLYEEALEEIATKKSDGGEYGEDEEKEAISSLKSALGKKYKDGEVSEATARKLLSEVFGLDEDDIYWTLDEWGYAKDNGSSDDYAQYAEFLTAVETGKNLVAVIKRYTDNGVKETTLSSQITKHFKPIYIGMSNSEKAGIKGYLLNAYTKLGYKREEAEDKIGEWQYEADYPDLVDKVTYTAYKRWVADGKPNGVSIEMFVKVSEFRDPGTSDSVKSQDEVKSYIESVTSDRRTRHALWCCFYKASTSPWR